ncbi:TM2 domain-containing protein [Aestuariibaculum suncheonense]|uniref:TM2 domain-containing protein n=1 Tax=Aestuariibaculum suncheonense TaxID=1028745 RepID=A0A8J6UKH9_9FLAO|nr:TM2 domain-containing protein [Aestuariibaculum suncheonense]MBD0835711.1 TM2 domain-containing protein [Aestuariibaculum suncheonense]
MKIKFLLTLLAVLTTYSVSYASFPVQRTVNTVTELTSNSTNEILTPITSSVVSQNKWVGVALWFFLGWPFAAHRWYYKKPVLINILFIITIAGLGIWGIVDLINILSDNF